MDEACDEARNLLLADDPGAFLEIERPLFLHPLEQRRGALQAILAHEDLDAERQGRRACLIEFFRRWVKPEYAEAGTQRVVPLKLHPE